MSLDCGHSPLWVWYVGKCQTFERASLQTVCLFKTSYWGWDQWFLLLPFWNVSSGILPLSFLKSANSWDRRVWKTDCVKSLRSTQCLGMSFHMRAHCTVFFWSCTWRGCESLVLQIHQRKLCETRVKERVLQNSVSAKFWETKLYRQRSASLKGR